MKFSSRNLLWVIPLAILITMPLWRGVVAGFLAPRVDKTGSAASLEKRFVMDGVVFTQARNGKREWLMHSRRLSSGETSNDFLMDEVDAIFFRADKKTGKDDEIHISGRNAEYNDISKVLTMTGEVAVKNSAGYELRTEKMQYLDEKKKLFASTDVQLTGKDLQVKGKSMEYDLASGDYRIGGRLTGKLR